MNEKNTGFRLRLNLFDCIVLLAALAIAALFLYRTFAPKQTDTVVTATKTIQYSIRLRSALTGTGEQISSEDALVDAIKNNKIGTVVSYAVTPARIPVLDEETLTLRLAEVPNREDINIVVSCEATESNAQLLLDGSYELRVGEPIYVRGPGYMGSGYVTAIEREA